MLSLWANWLVTKFGLNSLKRYLWPVLYEQDTGSVDPSQDKCELGIISDQNYGRFHHRFNAPNLSPFFNAHLKISVPSSTVLIPGTLSIKRNITSSEWCSLKSTPSKLIIFGHWYTIVLIEAHLKSQMVPFVKKGEKCGEIAHRSLVKSTETRSPRTSTKGRLFRTFNSYSFKFNGRLCNCRF